MKLVTMYDEENIKELNNAKEILNACRTAKKATTLKYLVKDYAHYVFVMKRKGYLTSEKVKGSRINFKITELGENFLKQLEDTLNQNKGGKECITTTEKVIEETSEVMKSTGNE